MTKKTYYVDFDGTVAVCGKGITHLILNELLDPKEHEYFGIGLFRRLLIVYHALVTGKTLVPGVDYRNPIEAWPKVVLFTDPADGMQTVLDNNNSSGALRKITAALIDQSQFWVFFQGQINPNPEFGHSEFSPYRDYLTPLVDLYTIKSNAPGVLEELDKLIRQGDEVIFVSKSAYPEVVKEFLRVNAEEKGLKHLALAPIIAAFNNDTAGDDSHINPNFRGKRPHIARARKLAGSRGLEILLDDSHVNRKYAFEDGIPAPVIPVMLDNSNPAEQKINYIPLGNSQENAFKFIIREAGRIVEFFHQFTRAIAKNPEFSNIRWCLLETEPHRPGEFTRASTYGLVRATAEKLKTQLSSFGVEIILSGDVITYFVQFPTAYLTLEKITQLEVSLLPLNTPTNAASQVYQAVSYVSRPAAASVFSPASPAAAFVYSPAAPQTPAPAQALAQQVYAPATSQAAAAFVYSPAAPQTPAPTQALAQQVYAPATSQAAAAFVYSPTAPQTPAPAQALAQQVYAPATSQAAAAFVYSPAAPQTPAPAQALAQQVYAPATSQAAAAFVYSPAAPQTPAPTQASFSRYAPIPRVALSAALSASAQRELTVPEKTALLNHVKPKSTGNRLADQEAQDNILDIIWIEGQNGTTLETIVQSPTKIAKLLITLRRDLPASLALRMQMRSSGKWKGEARLSIALTDVEAFCKNQNLGNVHSNVMTTSQQENATALALVQKTFPFTTWTSAQIGGEYVINSATMRFEQADVWQNSGLEALEIQPVVVAHGSVQFKMVVLPKFAEVVATLNHFQSELSNQVKGVAPREWGWAVGISKAGEGIITSVEVDPGTARTYLPALRRQHLSPVGLSLHLVPVEGSNPAKVRLQINLKDVLAFLRAESTQQPDISRDLANAQTVRLTEAKFNVVKVNGQALVGEYGQTVKKTAWWTRGPGEPATSGKFIIVSHPATSYADTVALWQNLRSELPAKEAAYLRIEPSSTGEDLWRINADPGHVLAITDASAAWRPTVAPTAAPAQGPTTQAHAGSEREIERLIEEYSCPISMSLMINPVTLFSGISLDKASLDKLPPKTYYPHNYATPQLRALMPAGVTFRHGDQVLECPLTRKIYPIAFKSMLSVNIALRSAIDAFCAQNPEHPDVQGRADTIKREAARPGAAQAPDGQVVPFPF